MKTSGQKLAEDRQDIGLSAPLQNSAELKVDGAEFGRMLENMMGFEVVRLLKAGCAFSEGWREKALVDMSVVELDVLFSEILAEARRRRR